MAKNERGYHNPHGDPCTYYYNNGELCGLPFSKHRVYHKFSGPYPVCDKCSLPPSKHKMGGNDKKVARGEGRTRYFGIDGEGIGRDNHRYIMIAAKSEYGDEEYYLESNPTDPNGRITTKQFLEFILQLAGNNIKVFSYAFNYDLTKGLMDLDEKSLYYLFRPELRKRRPEWSHLGPRPIKWEGYLLNLQGTKFSVRKGRNKVIVWDLFKFFQSKFVSALQDWDIGSPDLIDRMTIKKNQRAEFDKLDRDSIRQYCLEECQCMGALAHKLVDAHKTADLELRAFYGAGSSSAAMLTKMGIKDNIVPVIPEMKHAVASGFFGGRFENSVIGRINGKLYNKDISSAYPYHTTFLPCLLHGTWRHTTSRIDVSKSEAAIVHYGLGVPSPRDLKGNWGPFPYRTGNGTVTFPIRSGGGWVWKSEYLAGERIFDHIEFKEAWVYESRCEHKPFSKIPEYYIMRLNLGKEGAGKAIKLAVNGCYGKLAQSVGNAIFNNWIWAGMITAGCRAQGLDLMGMHKDRRNLLMIATDGLLSRENIDTPAPINTGTGMPIWNPKKQINESKPLGGWETDVAERGMFIARPGIYFPLNPTDKEIKTVKGRGLGKAIVLANWELIVDAFETQGAKGYVAITSVPRFCGAKTSISRNHKGVYKRANHRDGIKPRYGQWVMRAVDMGFDPMPKRAGVAKDGFTLILREFPSTQESVPYNRAMRSPESEELAAVQLMLEEQPDPDFGAYQ